MSATIYNCMPKPGRIECSNSDCTSDEPANVRFVKKIPHLLSVELWLCSKCVMRYATIDVSDERALEILFSRHREKEEDKVE